MSAYPVPAAAGPTANPRRRYNPAGGPGFLYQMLQKLHQLIRSYFITSRYLSRESDDVMCTLITMAILAYCLTFSYIVLF